MYRIFIKHLIPATTLIFLCCNLFAQAKGTSLDTIKNTLNGISRIIDTIPVPFKNKVVDSIHQLKKSNNSDHLEIKNPVSDIKGGFKNSKDTLKKVADSIPGLIKKSINNKTGSLVNDMDSLQKNIKTTLIEKTKALNPATIKNKFNPSDKLKISNKDSLVKSYLPVTAVQTVLKPQKLFELYGGMIGYNMNYRSYVDTPFAQKDLMQHNLYGSLGLELHGIPLRVNFLIRRTNSDFFRDINDVQVEFDANLFAIKSKESLRQSMSKFTHSMKDSLLQTSLNLNLEKYKKEIDWLNSLFTQQKFVESHETLYVPGINNDPTLPDSINEKNSAAKKEEALQFINDYNNRKNQVNDLKNKVDSLQKVISENEERVKNYEKFVSGNDFQGMSRNLLKKTMREHGINDYEIPSKYRWLSNIRRFALGKNQVNYSELTSKNLSLTGINFEYNSWYYVALTAGAVDYRFRDFIISKTKRSPQYMYMGRLGIGRLSNNFLIFSFYDGQKQLYTVTNANSASSSIRIKGISGEAKYRLKNNGFIIGEVAVSLSPDFRQVPVETQKFELKDKSNKALSLKLHYHFFKSRSTIDAMYKYTGGNFQSFSAFQTNSVYKSWYVKADQYLFKNKLKIVAALRSNEFSNPYIIQQYSSNAVSKSIQLTFHSRKLPTISAGFIPTSQITSVDGILTENHFYSLNASINHLYKVGDYKAASSFIYNRFYNNEIDTSLLYYNAENIFFNQVFYLKPYSVIFSISQSTSREFELSVLEGGLQFTLFKTNTLGFGARFSNFDKRITAVGGYINLQLNIKKLGILGVSYDHGYLPSNKHDFVTNKMMNINFSRVF